MTNIKPIRPLESIPHMLRFWADMFERGEEDMPKGVTLVCIANGNTPPTVFGAGIDSSRIEQAGALMFCAARVMEIQET